MGQNWCRPDASIKAKTKFAYRVGAQQALQMILLDPRGREIEREKATFNAPYIQAGLESNPSGRHV